MKIEMDYETRDNIIEVAGFTTLFAVVLMVVVMAIYAITADHRVRRYYVGYSGNPDMYSCVKADNPWETDDSVMCSPDPEKVVEFSQKANEQLFRTK